jgi:hypothetical protein
MYGCNTLQSSWHLILGSNSFPNNSFITVNYVLVPPKFSSKLNHKIKVF